MWWQGSLEGMHYPWYMCISLMWQNLGYDCTPHFKCGMNRTMKCRTYFEKPCPAWKRWEPICRDDLIFYSRNIKRNQLTCFSYHFFCQSAKNLCRDPPMKKMIKTANTRRAVIHMKGFVRNYCFFKMEC